MVLINNNIYTLFREDQHNIHHKVVECFQRMMEKMGMKYVAKKEN